MNEFRAMSLILFTFGMTVMGLSNLTTFFRLTSVDFLTTSGMGAFGLILCLVSTFVMLPDDQRTPWLYGLYGLVLFLAGLFHMSLSIVTIFFGLTPVDNGTATAAALGGLLLALIGCAIMPSRIR